MAFCGFLIIYAAVAALLFCTIGLDCYRKFVAPCADCARCAWIRPFALFVFALGAALWPLTLVAAFVQRMMEKKGGSPC